eukprot:CAMPEP_0117453318 /NCGR_PEP_ID=MMETSP0759-20121206/10150_1 /TAXON_ID=63605 /ORGANISM="Percolomonas cosmopolitus, Strain WS" /LENGTH=1142 /DNA_ID=CAMNT_0005246323 /DNA_START=121 /DNA_END=3549 /DNA_ORIENTATION=-
MYIFLSQHHAIVSLLSAAAIVLILIFPSSALTQWPRQNQNNQNNRCATFPNNERIPAMTDSHRQIFIINENEDSALLSTANSDSISLHLLESNHFLMKLYNGSVHLFDKVGMAYVGKMGGGDSATARWTWPKRAPPASQHQFHNIFSIVRLDLGNDLIKLPNGHNNNAFKELFLISSYDSVGVYDMEQNEYVYLWKSSQKHGRLEHRSPLNPEDYESPCEKWAGRNMEPLMEGIFPCLVLSEQHKKGSQNDEASYDSRMCVTADARISPSLAFNVTKMGIPFGNSPASSSATTTTPVTPTSTYHWCSSMASSTTGTLHARLETMNVALTGILHEQDNAKPRATSSSLILGYGHIGRDLFDSNWTWQSKIDTSSRAPIPSPVISPLGEHLCLAYMGFICFRTVNGSISWQVKSGLYVEDFALDDERLYAVQHLEETGTDTLVAFNLTNGEILWKFDATDEEHSGAWMLTIPQIEKVEKLQSAPFHFTAPVIFGSHVLVAFDAPHSHLHGFVKVHKEEASLSWQSTTSYPNKEARVVRLSNVMLSADTSSYYYEVTFSGALSTLKPLSQIIVSKYFSILDVQPKLLYTGFNETIRVFHNLGDDAHSGDMSCIVYVSYSSLANATISEQFSTSALLVHDDYALCSTSEIPSILKDGNTMLSVYLCLGCDPASHNPVGFTSNALDFEYATRPQLDHVNATGAPLGMNISLSLTGRHFTTLMHLPVKCRFFDANKEKSGFVETTVNARLISDSKVQCASFYPHFADSESGEIIPAVNLTSQASTCISVELSIDDGWTFFKSPLEFILYSPFLLEEVAPSIIPITAENPLYILGGTQYMDFFVAMDRIRCAFFDSGGGTRPLFAAHAECSSVGGGIADEGKRLETVDDERVLTSTRATSENLSSSPASRSGTPSYRCACLVNNLPPNLKRTGSYNLYMSLNGGINYNFTQRSIQFYNNPQLGSIAPQVGSIDGGQKVILKGNNFFASEDLVCRFAANTSAGGILVDAQFQDSSQVACITPQISINDTAPHGYLEVQVVISENGRDFTHTNVTFTFTAKQCPGEPLLCSGHGKCDPAQGTCSCDLGFTGAACETFGRIGYWTVVLIATFLVTIVFMAILLAFVTYFNRRSSQFNRMVKERKHNDISTAL